MSYQGPLLIREPELRWPILILAAIITTIIALIVAGLHYVAINQDSERADMVLEVASVHFD